MAKGILEVNLVDAKGLKDTDFLGKIDPYVLIQYRGQERKSKIARGQGTNPCWNETFKFSVHSAGGGENQHQHRLTLRIMDHDTFTADDFIGESTVYVGDVIAEGLEKGVGVMHPTKHSVVLGDRSYCGEIRVGVIFTAAKAEEEGTEGFGGWRHSNSQDT